MSLTVNSWQDAYYVLHFKATADERRSYHNNDLIAARNAIPKPGKDVPNPASIEYKKLAVCNYFRGVMQCAFDERDSDHEDLIKSIANDKAGLEKGIEGYNTMCIAYEKFLLQFVEWFISKYPQPCYTEIEGHYKISAKFADVIDLSLPLKSVAKLVSSMRIYRYQGTSENAGELWIGHDDIKLGKLEAMFAVGHELGHAMDYGMRPQDRFDFYQRSMSQGYERNTKFENEYVADAFAVAVLINCAGIPPTDISTATQKIFDSEPEDEGSHPSKRDRLNRLAINIRRCA